MRPIGTLLRNESPITIAREALWRVGRLWERKRVLTVLQNGACDVRVRRVGYFRPEPQTCNASSRSTIQGIADLVADGKFPFLGYGTATLGIPPAWNRDFVSGKDWPLVDASRIKIVRHDGSDIKVPWELSRLQFLPVLAKAHLLTGVQRYRDIARALVSHWIDQNPVGVGVNWTTAMEVALRAISICFLLDLVWPLRPDEQLWLEKVTRSLWQHLLYIESNLEFSHIVRGNHYISNLIGLFCLSTFLDGPQIESRRKSYQRCIEGEILQQTYEDGGDYEASTGYHVLVTQMFTCALLMMKATGTPPAPEFITRLRKMYSFAAAIADASDRIPHIGDCDDGRVELLLDDLEQMLAVPLLQRTSLAISSLLGTGSMLFGDFDRGRLEDAAWYGLRSKKRTEMSTASSVALSRSCPSIALFPQSGVAVLRHEGWEALYFAIPNGAHGKGSHTHNDKLSFVLRLNGEELFSDSGTGVYSREWARRNRFRSTAAHNTVLIDGVEQNRILPEAKYLFSLGNEAQVTPIQYQQIPEGFILSASHFGYHQLNVTHCRRLKLTSDGLVVEDILVGTGEHQFELSLHISPRHRVETQQSEGKRLFFRLEGFPSVSVVISSPVHLQLKIRPALISRSYGSSFSATCTAVRGRAILPVTVATRISCEGIQCVDRYSILGQ
jgi:Heparinase II/III-like protein/Heparinase II/III N-terminus